MKTIKERFDEFASLSGGGVNAAQEEGWRDLMEAACAGAELVLGSGADVDAKTRTGHTALMYAAANGQTDGLQALIRFGASPNLQTHNNGWSPLMFAAYHGNTDCVASLIEAGIRGISVR